MMPAHQLARADSERGEIVLSVRETDAALELRVNGVFVMDSTETSAERLLATATLARLPGDRGGLRVLVGGIGLGFTLAEVLRDDRVADVLVAEIEPALIDWHRRGLVTPGGRGIADPRVRIAVADVRGVVAAERGESFDVVLLDVDNGPGYLVYDANAAVYREDFLHECRRVNARGGLTAIWSSSPSAELARAMGSVYDEFREVAVPVVLGSRATSYHLFIGRRR